MYSNLPKNLHFKLPDNPFNGQASVLKRLTEQNQKLAKHAGMKNDKFKNAWLKLFHTISQGTLVETVLESKVDIRALALMLTSEHSDKIQLTSSLLRKISLITDNKPNNLLIESVFQSFLTSFKKIEEVDYAASWLINARKFRGLNKAFDDNLISKNGPKWLATTAIHQQRDFEFLVNDFSLNQYSHGDFLETAQKIYYVEQLKTIPVNKPHDLLNEVQHKSVFESKYNDQELLGHQILKILIERAPSDNLHETWLNVIIAIAGDPRVPNSHPRFIKWWSHISPSNIHKVRSWLSRLDLKLFLEALEDFSNASSDPEMKRMYPSRKRFLEGLYDKKLINNTRLYMSRHMGHFLKKNYKAEHLPDFSTVKDGDKSLIYVDLGDAHLIEGSHSCYLWVYKKLHESAVVYDYSKRNVSYSELTSGLNNKMYAHGCSSLDNITHNPTKFSWQRKAIKALKQQGVDIVPKDVLTEDDYRKYIRTFGVN